jgi:hypothetical protein
MTESVRQFIPAGLVFHDSPIRGPKSYTHM